VKNIYVGNLAFSVNEDQLRTMFQAYGKVEKVTLVRDRDTGQSRGFGFVEMANDGEADQAIAAINGTDVGGRTLNVNEARPRVERAGGFDRGRGGGRGGGRGRY